MDQHSPTKGQYSSKPGTHNLKPGQHSPPTHQPQTLAHEPRPTNPNPPTSKHNPPLTDPSRTRCPPRAVAYPEPKRANHNNNNNHDGDDINKNDINNDNNKNNKNHNHTNPCVASATVCRLRTLASKALNTFLPWPVAFRAAEKKKVRWLRVWLRPRSAPWWAQPLSGILPTQCAHAIRMPRPLVARTGAERIYVYVTYVCLSCLVSLPDCFYPAVGLGHGLCRACTRGNPAGGSPVRCRGTYQVMGFESMSGRKKSNRR